MFVIVTIISTSLSYVIMQYVGKHVVKDELNENQQAVAQTLQSIKAETQLEFEKLIKLVDNPLYNFLLIDDEGEVLSNANENILNQLSKADIKKIIAINQTKDNQIMSLNQNESIFPMTYIKSIDEHIFIFMNEKTIASTFIHRPIGFALSIALLIGILLNFFGAKYVSRPIQKLSKGLEQVGQGKFDIELPVRSHDEIGKMMQRFNEMAKELRGIVYLRRDFMNNICHELKTPLASIQGFARLLQSEELTAQQRYEYTQIISEEAERLSTLSVDLLNLSRLENQTILEEVERFNLAEEIRKVFLLLEPLWSPKDLQYELELNEIEIMGSKELLIQVVLNLFSNAIKFSTYQGKLEIYLDETEKDVIFKIKDTGEGMSEETQARIFEAFYQGETSHHKEGHGIGLSLVKRIVTLHQGTIEIESQLKKGTLVTVKLPKNM